MNNYLVLGFTELTSSPPFRILSENNIGLAGAYYKVQFFGSVIHNEIKRAVQETPDLQPWPLSPAGAAPLSYMSVPPSNSITLRVPSIMLQLGFPALTSSYDWDMGKTVSKNLGPKTKVLDYLKSRDVTVRWNSVSFRSRYITVLITLSE